MALTIRTTGIEDYLDSGDAFVKALVAGPPSAGKTRSASFWPRPIYADCEKGRMSIADRSVPYGEITSTDDMMALVRALKIECMKPVASRKYQTFVIDTIDAYQRIVVNERLNVTRKESMEGYADWGYLDAKMTQLISALLSLPMNIVVNMHVKEVQQGNDGPVTLQPKLKGDIRDQIAAEFDLVGLMGTTWVAENGERVLQRSIQWHPDPRVPWLKDRSGRLPKFTPVTFTEDDYTGLFLPLSAALDDLQASQDVEVMEGDADYEPVPPGSKEQAGGAVASPEGLPAKKAPAKKAPAKAPAKAVARPAVPAAKPTSAFEVREVGASPAPEAESAPAQAPEAPTDVPPSDVPDGLLSKEERAAREAAAEQPMTPEQVAEALGGEVVQQPDDEPAQEPAQPEAEPSSTTSEPGTVVPICGQPGKTRSGALNDNPVPGCGKSLEDESSDMRNIAFIRTSRAKRPTYLCSACLAAFKAAS